MTVSIRVDHTVTSNRSSGVQPELPNGWRSEVLRVSGELFLAHGYAGVSLAAVMSEAGGSFRDLYREFGSKDGLFLQAMQYLCEQVVSPWRSLRLEKMSLENALILFGRTLLSTLLSDRLIALHRLVLSESVRFPKLAQVWYEQGPHATSKTLGVLLASRAEAEDLELSDPVLEAALFIDSIVNNLQLRKLVGLPVSKVEIEDRVRTSVAVFLHGILRRHAPSTKYKGKIKG